MESPLRLIALNPVDRLARTVEALLVVASIPLSLDELADATEDHPERIDTAIGLLQERYAEGRSGIVLEEVAGGFAFRASRDAADACARLFERLVEPGQGGAVRYRTTPLFERVFGLESLAALPRLDDLGEDAAELRERLLEVAEARAS